MLIERIGLGSVAYLAGLIRLWIELGRLFQGVCLGDLRRLYVGLVLEVLGGIGFVSVVLHRSTLHGLGCRRVVGGG